MLRVSPPRFVGVDVCGCTVGERHRLCGLDGSRRALLVARCNVNRDLVRNCQTPVLILPDDIPAHPYAVAMETAMLAPKAEVSMFPWKEPKERIPLAVRQIRSFLRAHRPD
jgi:hypothetical protein